MPALALLLLLLLPPLGAQQAKDATDTEMAPQGAESAGMSKEELSKEDRAILSYALGYDVGRSVRASLEQMQAQMETFAMEDLAEGVRAGIENGVPKYLQSQMEPLVERWVARQRSLVDRDTAQHSAEEEKAWVAAAAKNLEEARSFLKDNKFKKGIKTTESGLQYQISRKGKGARPKSEDWVRVHYRGTTLDGREFDSSYSRNEPAVFPLNGVIPGWAEGMMLLKRNSQARLFVPPHLAYGEQGPVGGPLPFGPNSLLIFEVELLDFAASEESLTQQAGGDQPASN